MRPRPDYGFTAVGIVGLLLLNVTVYVLSSRSGALGTDLAQWYTAGTLVRTGQVDKLYDQAFFAEAAESITGVAFYSLYPPQLALVFAPLSRVKFETLVSLWFVGQFVGLACAVWLLTFDFKSRFDIARAWGLSFAFIPFAYTLAASQLSVCFLLLVACAYRSLQARRLLLAGVILSLLMVKPTLFVGLALWSVFLGRNAWRITAGMAIGSLIQVLGVISFLGPRPIIEYAQTAPSLETLINTSYRFGASLQHGLKGSLFHAGFLTEPLGLTLIYAIVLVLCLFVMWQHAGRLAVQDENQLTGDRYSLSLGVLVAVVLAPHLLTYDLLLLLVPVVLWITSSNSFYQTLGVTAYTVVMAAPLGQLMGISVVPFVLLAVVVAIGWAGPRFAVASRHPV